MEWEGGKNDVNIEICEEMETETEKEKGGRRREEWKTQIEQQSVVRLLWHQLLP